MRKNYINMRRTPKWGLSQGGRYLSLIHILGIEKVKNLFCSEAGYQTPKLDTRAAIFKEDKILLVKEMNGTWALPGGWVDVGLSVKENVIKEAKEEAGLDVTADMIIAVPVSYTHLSIGVCCIGRYDIETMPLAQLNAAKQVQAYLKGLYPGAAKKKHKDVNATSCPGKNFPFSEIARTAGDASAEASAAGQGTSPSGNWYARLQAECNAVSYPHLTACTAADHLSGKSKL